jgi:histone H3/H4
MTEETEVLVVVSKVRAYLKSKDAMMSGELIEALNKKVYGLLDDAVTRCKGNKRLTVKAQDI